MKIPQRSAFASSSGVVPLDMFQATIDPITEASPAKKQTCDNLFFILLYLKNIMSSWLTLTYFS